MVISRKRDYSLEGLDERFWKFVDKRGDDDCWEWTGSTRNGYGRFNVRHNRPEPSVLATAHRIAWELTFRTRLPNTILVLHRCDNPPCCNPNHLFLGNQELNMLDMKLKGRRLQSECKRGHKFEEGTYKVRKSDGHRICILCSRERRRRVS